MSITITGYVLIVLGLYAVVFNRKFLYELTIFFIPFTATAVINVGAEGEGSAIQPFMFFGTLWMLGLFINYINKGGSFNLFKAELNSLIFLLGFTLVAFISLAMPIIINGKEMANQTGVLGESVPVVFTSKNITQYLYLLFGVFFAISIYFYNRKSETIYNRTVKIYAYAVLFVIFWGLLQFVCNNTSIAYPADVFNNSYSKFASGYLQILDDDSEIKRISSVSVEPSIMVQSILVFLPFLIFSIIYKKTIFNRLFDKAFVFIIIVFIFLSTSSSGIITLALVGIMVTYKYLKIIPPKRRTLVMVTGVIIIPIILISVYLVFNDIINSALFSKSDSYSALERANSVIMGWDSFATHPILGLGWGAVTSLDLVVKILSNTGIIGFVFFFGWIITVIRNQYKAQKLLKDQALIRASILISFYVLLFTNMTSGFSSVFGFFWLFTGLIIIYKFKLPVNENIIN